MSKTNVKVASEEPQMFGHPKGLFYLFFAELWERFSFYGMRALLTLYMVQEIFKAIVERDAATAVVYASYGSLVYASTVIGGQISDKILGMRTSIFLGGICMAFLVISVGPFLIDGIKYLRIGVNLRINRRS